MGELVVAVSVDATMKSPFS